jgi:hypothetical protein
MVAHRGTGRPFGEQTVGFYIMFCMKFLVGLSIALAVLSALVGVFFVLGMAFIVAIGTSMGG